MVTDDRKHWQTVGIVTNQPGYESDMVRSLALADVPDVVGRDISSPKPILGIRVLLPYAIQGAPQGSDRRITVSVVAPTTCLAPLIMGCHRSAGCTTTKRLIAIA